MHTYRYALSAALLLAASCGSSTSTSPIGPGTTATTADPIAEPPAPAVPATPTLRLPDSAAPLGYIVNLELDPAQETFKGNVRINVALAGATDHLWLHGTDLTVESATLKTDSEALPATVIPQQDEHFLGFTFPKEVSGKVWLEVSYQGKVAAKDWSGLFRQEHDKRWYLYSQGEAFGARRMFPSFDEPRWKTPFTVTLTVPADLHAFSNTPVKSTAAARDGWKTVAFETTKPLPTYLNAFAVGPFEIVEVGKVGRNKTPVRILALAGKTEGLDFARKAVVELHNRLEDYFDMAYPYAKLDHIVLPRFLGAMENPGLITYDASLLHEPEGGTSWAFERRSANVIGHEIAHQWFGNLVTLAWWDDIWLNESFATWMAAKVVNQWKPSWKGVTADVAMRAEIMTSDSLISARKIRQPIVTHSDIAGAFDGITYGKGAAMLWMFEELIGEAPFRDGMRAYMREHAWKTTTADDFLAAIGKVSDPAVPDAFRTFLDQAGVPVVSASLACDKGQAPVLTLTQERYLPTGSKGSAEQTWKLPVCVSVDGTKGKTCKLVQAASEEWPLATKKCPRWVNINAGAAGYYRAAYSAPLLEGLLTKGGKSLSSAERITLIADLNALVSANKLGVGDALAQLPRLMKDKDPLVVESALGIVGQVADNMLPPALQPNMARYVRKTFGARARAMGWTAKKGDDAQTKKLRSRLLVLVAIRGDDKGLQKQARKLADTWLATGEGVATEDLAEVLSAAAYNADAAFYDKLAGKLAATDDARTQGSLIAGMAAFRDPALVKRNLETFLTNDKLPLRASFGLLSGGLAHHATREMNYAFIKDNYKAVSEKLPAMARAYVMMVARAFCDQAHYDDAKAFFGPIAKKEMQGEKILAQVLEGIELCMAFTAAQGPKVEQFLKTY